MEDLYGESPVVFPLGCPLGLFPLIPVVGCPWCPVCLSLLIPVVLSIGVWLSLIGSLSFFDFAVVLVFGLVEA